MRGRPAGSAAIVHQDDFFTTTLDDPTDYGPDRPNLETPSGIDWGRLLATIADAREGAGNGGLVVVEGFLLLAAGEDGSSALPLFDAIFFLEADEAECLRRRLARNPDDQEVSPCRCPSKESASSTGRSGSRVRSPP